MLRIKDYHKEKMQHYKEIVSELGEISVAIVQIGHNPASDRYVRNKIKDLESVGIKVKLIAKPEYITQEDLEHLVYKLNYSDYTGFIVQLPLPKHLDEKAIRNMINPDKDIDGFAPTTKVFPCTPQGIITYLEDQNYDFNNKNAVVIGRSALVGRPIAGMLLDRNCNVSVIHSKTSEANKNYLLSNADLIICATGHRDTITDENLLQNVEWNYDETNNKLEEKKIFNANSLLIDVGINFDENGKLVGDCEHVSGVEKTPVPGGVGLLTRLALIENVLKLRKRNEIYIRRR